MKIRFFCILLITLFIFIDASFSYVTRTKSGSVRGIKKHTSGKATIYAYLGIPYAIPPIGDLRFQPPQPIAKWKDVWNANVQKPQCIQSRNTLVRTSKIEGSEDCLYLNIYTPSPPNTKDNITYPVMVWIHGGGFFEGDNTRELYPPDSFVAEDIIVVTVAYRLNVFGFLSTGDLSCPGNNGIKDQIMALKWVKENIACFGGDHNNITIWGESAGGISVSHLTLSPKTAGLYNRAIIESGSSIMAIAVGILHAEIAFKTGELLGIITNNTGELITELKSVGTKELLSAATRAGSLLAIEHALLLYPFTTVIEPEHENAVITKSPYLILENNGSHQTPVLMGFNSNEGDGLPDALPRAILAATQLNPLVLIPAGLNAKSPEDAQKVGSAIKEHYFKTDTVMYSEANFVHWYGDMHVIRPMIQQGQLLSKYTDVYFYRFNCTGLLGNDLRTNWAGVGHAEELNFLFPRRTQPKFLSDDDKLCSKRLVKMWANFAKHGSPTVENDPLLDNIHWPKSAPTPNMKYLNIAQNLSVEVNPNEKDFRFWTDIYEKYGTPPYTVW